MFSSSTLHLLITLCTQLTQIRGRLQSWSRKLELKGFSLSLSLLPSSFSRHFSSNGVRQTERRARRRLPRVRAGTLFTSPPTLSRSRAPGPGVTGRRRKATHWAPKARTQTVLEWRTNEIGGTVSRWVSKATEKRSTFHPLMVFLSHTLNTHAHLQNTVQTFNTTYFQVLDVNNKQIYISEENERLRIQRTESTVCCRPARKVGRSHRPSGSGLFGLKSADASTRHETHSVLCVCVFLNSSSIPRSLFSPPMFRT